MKRKINEEDGIGRHDASTLKRRAAPDGSIICKSFREGFFDGHVLESYRREYAKSKPYRHGVIRNLVSDELLRSVRNEIQENLHFSPKETDIYRIHQSGDLANLDGLDDSSLAKLPSLLKLRDALYSATFREELAKITGSGPLSGKKTDMAINVYTPGSYLLCHDDVIGSRRVSYILYLTDPDKPWRAEWGGALQLYDATSVEDEDGQITRVPDPEPTLSIPPSFNQLTFFAVQPGESFHDVEEVRACEPGEAEREHEGGRVRMAISGWFHIPQRGEDGYIEGLEEELAGKSSLVQLQGKADRLDLPQPRVYRYEKAVHDNKNGSSSKGKEAATNSEEDEDLTEADLDLLLKYIAPTYLTPDTLEDVCAFFTEESSLKLEEFLSPKFSARLKAYVEREEQRLPLPEDTNAIESNTDWHVARPPHKHRFLYQQATEGGKRRTEKSPLRELLEDLFPSNAFRKWLSIATSLTLDSCNVLARRFRRGKDFSLATGYGEERARIELTLGITPTGGWDADGDEDDKQDLKERGTERPDADVGGYEMYYAEEDDEDAIEDDGDDDLGKDEKQRNKKAKSDPAIYKSSSANEDGANVLFSSHAAWNSLSIVLRDRGVLRFVKYVSRQAPGDRWDVTGEWGVAEAEESSHDHDV